MNQRTMNSLYWAGGCTLTRWVYEVPLWKMLLLGVMSFVVAELSQIAVKYIIKRVQTGV